MTTTLQTMELTLTRTIAASPAQVFDAWMDPKHPGNPWTGAERLIFDPRVDGLFYFLHVSKAGGTDARARHDAALALADGQPWAHYGRFIAIERDTRVQYAWMSPFTRGLESVVKVVFSRTGDGTLVTLSHTNLPDDEHGRVHERGWNSCLDTFGEPFAVRRVS
jgi:uncharacterized protein YndB with AHSA1/START domain